MLSKHYIWGLYVDSNENYTQIDAIGGAIHHIGKLHKYFGESAPEHTMFVITTDGQENASHKYTSEQVKKMIDDHWCFTCTMHLQSCINAGRCLGDKKRGDEIGK